LTRQHRDLLAGLAGLPAKGAKADAMIADVENDLSDAASFRDSVEQAPTDAGQAELLLSVEQAANALTRALLDLDQGSWFFLSDRLRDDKQFTAPSCVLHDPNDDMEQANVEELSALARCARAQRLDLLRKAKKGRGAEEARKQAIDGVATAFHEHAEPRRDGENNAVKFVSAAIAAAGFIAPADDKLLRMIPRPFRKPKKQP
jgi:hypothetical protein